MFLPISPSPPKGIIFTGLTFFFAGLFLTGFLLTLFLADFFSELYFFDELFFLLDASDFLSKDLLSFLDLESLFFLEFFIVLLSSILFCFLVYFYICLHACLLRRN